MILRSLLFLATFSLHASASYSIAFIYAGKNVPYYTLQSVHQAALFNKDCEIFFLVNSEPKKLISKLKLPSNVRVLNLESLRPTKKHQEFKLCSGLNRSFREGFWFYTTERLFYLEELMKQHDLKNVFHLESDVLLYRNLEELLPHFEKHYPGIGATFDSDSRVVLGLSYFRSAKAVEQLTEFLHRRSRSSQNEMNLIGQYCKMHSSERIAHLPVLMPEYAKRFPLKSKRTGLSKHPELFSNHYNEFKSVFDAAALGQYVGGIDPLNGLIYRFINRDSVYDVSKFQYRWERDSFGRKIPYLVFDGKKCRVNNLHIHSKRLSQYTSKPFPSHINGSLRLIHNRGRLGDQLLALAKVKWMAHLYQLPYKFQSIRGLENLAISGATEYTDTRGKWIRLDRNRLIDRLPISDTFYNICVSLHSGEHYSQKPREIVEWMNIIEEADFLEKLRDEVRPISSVSKVRVPEGHFSVAVHVRKGGGFDQPLSSKQFYLPEALEGKKRVKKYFVSKAVDTAEPFKFPPDQYYLDQIYRLSEMLGHRKIYVHLFTDDRSPLKLKREYEDRLGLNNVVFSCRIGENRHDLNVVEDLFAMTQFDALIRGGSNFSQAAHLLGQYKIAIYPTECSWVDGKILVMDKVQTCIDKSFSF